MDKTVIASMRRGAGKTSLIVGMADKLGQKIGYMKPFGDRPVYRKKRLWDYDTSLMTSLYGLGDNPEDMCLGFDHSKLRYMYSGDGTKDRLLEAIDNLSEGKDRIFIEGGQDLMYGTYVHLGSLSLAKHSGAKLIIVVSGDNDTIIDDCAFIKKYIDQKEINFGGVIINKVNKPKEFKGEQKKMIEEMGLDVLGVVPNMLELTHLSVAYLSEALFAKVITAEENLNRSVENILIGAMSVDLPLQKILSERKKKLMITSGDRSDMIVAALESDTEAIVLTNNILPPANIISKAEDKGVPMLLVPFDTYRTSKQIDDLEPLLDCGDKKRRMLLAKIVGDNVDLKKI